MTTIKRGYVADQYGQITQAWTWNGGGESCPYPDNLTLAPGDVVIEDTESSADDWESFQRDLGGYYVADGARVAKAAMSLTVSPDSVPADGATVATVSGVPAGSQAIVSGQTVTVDDGALEVSFDLAGTYIVSLSHPHYLPETVIIHAT